MRPPTFALGSRTIGEGQPCFVLAEVASAHGGEADRALRMLESAFKMGADGIKFQLFRSNLLVVRRHPGRKDFDQIELSEKEWRKVLREAKASGLTVLVEPFDLPSLRVARARYRPQIAFGADGGATARILDLVRSTAGVPVGGGAVAGAHGRVRTP